MIEIRSSTATVPNRRLRQVRRRRGENNVDWLSRVLRGEDAAGGLVLIGGAGLTDFRLRVAQSQARRDLLPSFWSHVALVERAEGGDWALREVSLEPAGGFGAVALENGVQRGRFRAYADADRFPNVAFIRLTAIAGALADGESLPNALARAVTTFQKQRSLVQMADHLVEWLAFVWGAPGRANPLLTQVGIPSAVFVESAFGIAGIELTPGLATQSSCPEAMWQAAKWWHEFYASEASLTQAPPSGWYVIDQPAAAVLDEPAKALRP